MNRHQNILIYLVLGAFFVGALAIASYMTSVQKRFSTGSQAASQYTIQSSQLVTNSTYQDAQNATFFNLASRTKENGLYALPEISSEAVIHFLAQKPLFTLSSNTPAKPLIPDISENIRLKTSSTDAPVGFGLQNLNSQSTHFYFEQTRCADTPVFGSYINIHVSKSAQIYALSGSLAEGEARCKENLSQIQMNQKAISAYVKAFPEETSSEAPAVRSAVSYVYSPKLFGETDSNDYLSSKIIVCTESYCHTYFVDQGDGTIRKDYPATLDAKNRYVFLSSAQRREGAGPVGNATVDKVYDIMGNVWDHYNTAYQRDSHNGRGGLIQVRLQSCSQIDASWNGFEIYSCSAIADTDVLAHEFQHGVTESAMGLAYESEQGALNEALSDIFASVIDKDDWLMGEEGVRAIRSLENPHQFGQPDTAVESRYVCGGSDHGGVHTNSGVVNKAFFLMSDGGTHSGCTVAGIGREAAGKVVYKAVSVYMAFKSNATFQDTYSAVNLACNDIYGASSAQCANMKAAMESTFMDKPNRCRGGKSTDVATCNGASQPPIPTGGGPVPTSSAPTPTQPPSGSQPTAVPTPTGTATQPTPTTVQPTPTPIVQKQAPLLSTLSSPKLLTGEVAISKVGEETTMTATIDSASLTALNLTVDDVVKDTKGRLIGTDVIETGNFISRNGKFVNEFKTTQDISKLGVYQVYITKSSQQKDDLPILLADINAAPSSSDNTTMTIDLALRFQGITRKPPSTQAQLVRVGLSGGPLEEVVYQKAVFTPDENGKWHGRVIFPYTEDIANGAIRIKGPRHAQKKYCVAQPTESAPGESLCPESLIQLHKGINTLDFTGVVQLAGDVNQDGRVNSSDINKIRSVIGSVLAADLAYGDMNNDGVTNSIDDGLAKYTLSNRTEQ